MSQPSTISRIVLAAFSLAFAVPCLFFTYYTIRLIWVNLTASAGDAAAHRTSGMLIGAIAFPLAAIVFGLVSYYLWRRAFSSERR